MENTTHVRDLYTYIFIQATRVTPEPSKLLIKEEKKEVGFPRIFKNSEFPRVLVFYLGISKGCHTILQIFQWLKLVFSRVFRDKGTNLKISRGDGFRKISSTPVPPPHPAWILSGIAHCHYQLFYIYYKGKTPLFFNMKFLFLFSERGFSCESCLAIW